MLDYRESSCLSCLRRLITINVQNILFKRFDNELIDYKNLRLPSYRISMIYVLSHQLFGDANRQSIKIVRLEDCLLFMSKDSPLDVFQISFNYLCLFKNYLGVSEPCITCYYT